MITAIAIDDEPLALAVIEAFCNQIGTVELQKAFTETSEALRYLRKYPVDLLFLDINMPAMSGIDFYKAVAQNTMVIFTTAYSEYAVEGFNLDAIDYLLKPIEYTRFQKAVQKALDYHEYIHRKSEITDRFLFVRADYSLIKVSLDDIVYIEGLDNYLKIYLTDGKYIMARMSMKAIQEKLNVDFIRVHRSYIVPFRKVTAVRNKIIYIGNKEIPVGVNYIDSVSALFKNR